MKCFHPITVKGQVVPCGKCPACLLNRQRNWMIRLSEQRACSDISLFVTATYDDDHLPRDKDFQPDFSKRDCQLFFKRLRKHWQNDCSFSYFLVSELGDGTFRPHYHFILFVRLLPDSKHDKYEVIRQLYSDMWPIWGMCAKERFTISECLDYRIRYVSKYCCKPTAIGYQGNAKPFTLVSRGIGLGYIDKLGSNVQKLVDSNFRIKTKFGSMSLNPYYKNKLFPHSPNSDKVLNDLMSDPIGNAKAIADRCSLLRENARLLEKVKLEQREEVTKKFEDDFEQHQRLHPSDSYFDYQIMLNYERTRKFLDYVKHRKDL